MRKRKILVTIMAMVLMIGMLMPTNAQAASKAKKAYKAYYNAINNDKTIKYSSEEWKAMKYMLVDYNKDGIKELVVYSAMNDLTIYGYKNGKVKKLATGLYPEYEFRYDSKNKKFWMFGEGDGGWMICYKVKSGKFKETLRYASERSVDGTKVTYYKQTAGKSQKSISKSTYNKQVKAYKKFKGFKSTSKSKLLKTLKKMY